MGEINDAERVEWLRATATPETVARCEDLLANWQSEGYTSEDWQTIAIGNVRTVGNMAAAVLALLRAMQRVYDVLNTSEDDAEISAAIDSLRLPKEAPDDHQ